MSHIAEGVQDVMQVCRNGHVITDLLHTCPERGLPYCDRCGAETVIHCATCGQELPGALAVGGLQPIGVRQPPSYCATCGAAFPWTERRPPPRREALVVLETMLRRLPLVIRQLRVRHGDRPPFRVADQKDMEDLLRSVLPLHFEDIRPECRTPRYAAVTRTDFLLAEEDIALTIKFAEPNLGEQLEEDAAYYQRERKCRTLVVFLYDPEGLMREPDVLEMTSCSREDKLEVRCVVGTQ
jgi:hypothetical protein